VIRSFYFIRRSDHFAIDRAPRPPGAPGILQNWTAWFGDEYDNEPPIPTLMNGTTIDLEGHTIAVHPPSSISPNWT
jgi:hypothetical protein